MFSKRSKQQHGTFDTNNTGLNNEEELFDDTSYELEDETVSKPPKKKLPSWVIIPILAVLVLGIWGISALTGGSQVSNALSLKVTEVAAGNIKEVYNASGKIESENTKTYYSPVTAPITNFNAVVGSTVKAGDLLVTYDTTNLERDNQQAQLNLQSALNTAQSTKDKSAQALKAANAALAQTAGQVSQLEATVNDLAQGMAAALTQYQANQASAAAAAPQQENLRRIVREQQALVTASQQILDEINANYGGRRADLDTALAKPEADRTKDDNAVIQALKPIFDRYDIAVNAKANAQAKMDEANRGINNDPVNDAGYGQLKAQYDEAAAQLRAAKNAASAPPAVPDMNSADIANLSVTDNLAELAALTPAELMQKGKEGMKADMDGVIASLGIEQTNTASQGMALFSIASMNDVRVKIEVSPDDYAKMRIGSNAAITVGPNKYEGTLTKVDKIAINNLKGNPVIGAQIHIKNPDENVCIGATAKISMTVEQADDVLVVPTEVINTASDGDFVYVINQGIVKKRPVELGTSSATKIEIKSGLKKGEQVVNDLNVNIKDGLKATPVSQDNTGKTGQQAD